MTTGENDEATRTGAGTGTGNDDAGGASVPAGAAGTVPQGVAARPSWVRRLLRNRAVLASTAAGLVGVLLGAGTVAWRTDTLPLLKPDPCWDSLRDAGVSALFGDRRLEVEEQELRLDPNTASLSYGQCRITSFKGDRTRRQAIVRVHTLDGLYGKDGRSWPAEFLSSRMVALGTDLPGMVSASRAWLALPQSCVGRPGSRLGGATVVDVALGEHDFDTPSDYDEEDRDAMTRVIVDAANGVIRELGCTGAYRAPEKLPDLPHWDDVQPGAFCGVKGLELPARYREALVLNRVGGEGGAARTCDAGHDARPGIRMSTVVDPAVAGIYSLELRSGGARVDGTEGDGTISPTRAAYRLSCQTGPVVMAVENLEPSRDSANFVRDLLPGYVEAESERLGCGPVKVKLPAP
ncbi:hypothetical protein [Streptomyces viridosporus]|uniref:hypothetical protein n=1 Tax=Streptomyces viridosporus TaxID=67581 RepID=UPI0009BFAEEB|nr:hypothetical protein [Streptomyces viridosporus]